MPEVDVFFYGSYINVDVLAEVDLRPDVIEVASVAGFSLTIAPLANLVPAPGAVAWGILTRATHAELERLYLEHAQGILGGVYLPQAVLCHKAETNDVRPALTYLSHDMAPVAADPDYIQRITGPARRYGFPVPYLQHIQSFAPR